MESKKQSESKDTIKVYCFSKHGEPHCPLVTRESDLRNYFNYFTEDIIWMEIDKSFVCEDERTRHCKNCPFR